jgi:hypothetical protein
MWKMDIKVFKVYEKIYIKKYHTYINKCLEEKKEAIVNNQLFCVFNDNERK